MKMESTHFFIARIIFVLLHEVEVVLDRVPVPYYDLNIVLGLFPGK